jgi:cyclase
VIDDSNTSFQAVALTPLINELFILSSPFFQSKRGLIIDRAGSLLIDTSISLAETQLMAEHAKQSDHPISRIVLTHSHFDHSLGCQLFPRIERIAQMGAGEWMLSNHAQEYASGEPPEHPDLKRLEITLPTIEIEGNAIIRLETHTLQLFPTPGHSSDSMSVLVEPYKILFSGDALVTCYPPIIEDGDSGQAITSHQRLLETDFSWLVPGHGPVLNYRDAYRVAQTGLNYLQELRSRLGSITDPNTPFDEVKEFVSRLTDFFPDDMDMLAHWHGKAVAKVWREHQVELQD